MTEQVIRWANISSGSYDVAGLARMREALESALATFGSNAVRITLPGAIEIDAAGKVTQHPLGDALLHHASGPTRPSASC